jgi:dTDP-4-dehydrorhamnose reductase
LRVLVTGATGLLGKLAMEAGRAKHEMIGLGREALDVTDRVAVAATVSRLRPDVVLHCAAYTAVDRAEGEPDRAMALNADSVEWVAKAAIECGAIVVYVGTDYVFDGEANVPYREEDKTRPISVYGRTKREGERRLARLYPQGHVIVRTAWLYGPGKGFVDWARDRLLRGEELTLIDDQRGSLTYAGDLARGIFTLVEQGHRGLFHLVNRGGASWHEIGRALAGELSIAAPKLRAIQASDLARAAPRPSYSVLSVERFERATGARVATWREALHRYLSIGQKGGVTCES